MKPKLTLFIVLVALAVWFFVGSHQGPPLGKQCTIQFRRDVLGVARDLPVPPTTNSINGAETSVRGTLLRSDEEWLVLQIGSGGATRETWIPKQLVLLIQYHDP